MTGEEKEMMNKKATLALLVAAVLITGCASRTAPIQNVSQTVAQSYSDQQMQRAIVEAGAANHWVISPAGPGVMNGLLAERGHTANIRITYTANSYRIDYVSSTNLKADSGQIHRNYNRWIQNLNQGIQTRLAVQAVK